MNLFNLSRAEVYEDNRVVSGEATGVELFHELHTRRFGAECGAPTELFVVHPSGQSRFDPPRGRHQVRFSTHNRKGTPSLYAARKTTELQSG